MTTHIDNYSFQKTDMIGEGSYGKVKHGIQLIWAGLQRKEYQD
jgi:hypothetical protein